MNLSRRQKTKEFRRLIRDFRRLDEERRRQERQDALQKLGEYLDQSRSACHWSLQGSFTDGRGDGHGEVFCNQHTNGDVFTDEPSDATLVAWMRAAEIVRQDWKRHHGHGG